MTITPRLLSEIELLPKEYEQEILDFVSFLKNKANYVKDIPSFANSATSSKNSETLESIFGIWKDRDIDINSLRKKAWNRP